MEEQHTLSYREVVPDLSSQEDWIEIVLNTGGAQSTLQDIKVVEKSGGYCYKNVEIHHNRNRFIYWRKYKDILELSEISLDFNLYQNNVRYRFTDAPVVSVSITESERFVTLLVVTVCSLHRINFPHPDTLADGTSSSTSGGTNSSANSSSSSSGIGVTVDFNESQTFSIFRDANANSARDPVNFYVFDAQQSALTNSVPHAASSCLSKNTLEAYFAVAFQSQLMLYTMNSAGNTTVQQLKEHNIMPRLLSNLKGAFTGKTDSADADLATSLVFTTLQEQLYLLALYRNDQLRLWCLSTLQSVASVNCVRGNNEQRVQGPQGNCLRKITDNSVCAFLSHANGAEFVRIDISSNAAGTSLACRRIVTAPQLDLTDFDVSVTRIWALWSNAEGEFSISSFSLHHGMGVNWVSAAMEPPPDRYSVGLEQAVDPRNAYCSYIFHPGKFERSVIAKALLMFRRSQMRFDAKHCSMSLLKEQVCQAVDDEIQNEIKDFEVSDEEYLEIATRLWERFYSCCEQYHMKASQPTGLQILEPIDALCVIKKNTFSLLRPCEILEHLILSGDDVDMHVVVPLYFENNEQAGQDLVHFLSIIAQLEKWLPEDVKIDVDRKLYQLEMPDVLIARLSEEILAGDPDREILPRNFLALLRQKLQIISNLSQAIELLLNSLRMDNGNPGAMQTTHLGVAHSTRFFMTIGTLFGSQIGLSLLTETVRQTALMRFSICRNLLLLQQLLLDTYSLPIDLLETMRSDFMPDAVLFLQSYFVMNWIAETTVNLSTAAALETSIQRLNLLDLVSGSGRIYSGNNAKCHAAPLMRVFLNAKGLYTALALYTHENETFVSCKWQHTLLPLTNIISQLIWPVSFNFVFGEWLFGTCQHIIIEDYVRLLNNWCEWNVCSRQFMLAVSFLDCGEAYKAYDLFLQSAKGVLKEQFLMDKILKGSRVLERLAGAANDMQVDESTNISISNQAMAQYYLKIIQLFEQHDALDHIIEVAETAIGLLDKTDSQTPMFQSIVFNNHLQLEQYEEAYHALMYNVELARRKDCLRQLVVTLFNNKRLDLLLRFPYVGLQEEFENIVESRARSLTMEENNIYDFLYSFHVNNQNMRKASAVMYEQAMRCQLENESIESMQKRKYSLLICINALHLIDSRYQWIAKPVLGDENSIIGSSALNGTQSELMDSTDANTRSQIVVLEIDDIRRELLHTESLLLLAQHRKDVQRLFNAGPQELTMILANCGLFTAALKLAKCFEQTLLPIFESLAAACVRTSEESANESWCWLQENDLADLPHRNKAADMAWSLLQKLVQENEEERSTQVRKAVANKLLSLNAFLPQWLYNEYKLSNCPELLYLYVKHHRLLEAAELAEEMLNAMIGSGSEYFSCKHSATIAHPELYLPVNTLDLLLHGLNLNASQDIEYKQAALELEEMLQRYINIAKQNAQHKILMAAMAPAKVNA